MANEVVGQAGLEAIRDFIKPYIIDSSVISNSSDIFSNYWADDFSAYFFGHTSIRYTWWIDSGIITEALKWNFWQVTEDESNGLTTIILCKVNPNTYEGMRTDSNHNAYYYTVKVSSNQCDVWVRGSILPTDSLSNTSVADVCLVLTNLMSFSAAEINQLFISLISGSSFVFTKTETGSVPVGSDMSQWYFMMPLDTSNTAMGTVCMRINGGSITTTNPVDIIAYWQGESYFFNKHQKWQMSYNTISGEKVLVLINTQDVAIQTLSAAQYASITKDPNTLYFIPEE